MDKLATQDRSRILKCLQQESMTTHEIAVRVRLTLPRVNSLVHELHREGLIHAPRCTPSAKGQPVNVWTLRDSTEDLDSRASDL